MLLEDVFSFNFDGCDRLEGANAYKCDKCKRATSAELRPRIGALPSRYLICHLVRTEFDPKTFALAKNQTDVLFPATDLDLTSFIDPVAAAHISGSEASAEGEGDGSKEKRGKTKSSSSSSSSVTMTTTSSSSSYDSTATPSSSSSPSPSPSSFPSSSSSSSSSERYIYDLFAVVTHHGRGMQEGHFTAFAKSPITKTWLLFNDAVVKPVEVTTVQQAQAYMLFYERKQV